MLALITQNVLEAKKTAKYVDAFILPVKDFSINYQNTFTLEEVKEIINLGKEVFVILNKNIHNSELKAFETILKEVEKLKVKGIFFYDIATINLKKKLNLKTDLVWSQEHLTTNYETINYWYNKGVKYAYLSSELTKNEIDEICQHAKATLFVNVFGYLPMFTSKRHLVNNYLKYFNIKDSKKEKHIHKEEKNYPIIDEVNGTTVYSDYILNTKDETFNAHYLVYNSFKIDNIEEVLKENTLPKVTGFLYEEIIYKVKKQ